MSKQPKKESQSAVGGPFVSCAVVCEKVLRESDGVQSLIRVFDRLTVQLPKDSAANGAKPKRVIPLTVAVAFKSGDFNGTKTLEIEVHRTAKDETKPLAKPFEIAFEGGEQGPGVIVETLCEVFGPELIWFVVLLDKKVVSKIPLRIVVDEVAAPPMPVAEAKTPKKAKSAK
jgi:hypothetical protein